MTPVQCTRTGACTGTAMDGSVHHFSSDKSTNTFSAAFYGKRVPEILRDHTGLVLQLISLYTMGFKHICLSFLNRQGQSH